MGVSDLSVEGAFAKLLAKCLDGVSPEAVDLKCLLLTGFAIKPREDNPKDGEQPQTLNPVGAGAGKG